MFPTPQRAAVGGLLSPMAPEWTRCSGSMMAPWFQPFPATRRKQMECRGVERGPDTRQTLVLRTLLLGRGRDTVFRMCPHLRLFFIALWMVPALPSWAADPEPLFSQESVVYREHDLDRRFLRSQIQRLLVEGTKDPNCGQVIGGLLALLAEAAPTLHKRDENFLVDPALLKAADAQLTRGTFSGSQYLAMMVRRVFLEGKLPPAWLKTATQLNATYRIIDLAKLRFLADGVDPIDSFLYSAAALRQVHREQVEELTSLGTSADLEFKDKYLDREVAWGDFTISDIRPENAPRPEKGQSSEVMVATLEWTVPKPNPHELLLFAKKQKLPEVRAIAHLRPKQYTDLFSIKKGQSVWIRGRLWDVDKDATHVQLRNALLFEKRDFSKGVVLATPKATAACPAAINELTGMAPQQSGAFAH